MATPLIIQNTQASIVVYLELDEGGPAIGLVAADVTVGLKKAGGAFANYPITGANFTEVGNGFYELDLDAADTNTLGQLYLTFVGTTFRAGLVAAMVATGAVAPPAPSPAFTPTVTDIFGYIYGPNGEPIEGSRVVARVVQQPTLIHPTTDSILIGSNFQVTQTDETGFFTISLIAGATVEFIISDGNYRRTVVIPATTANLFDIP